MKTRVELTGIPVEGSHPPLWTFCCAECGFTSPPFPKPKAVHMCAGKPGPDRLACKHNQGPTGETYKLPGCGQPETAIFGCEIFTQCVPFATEPCAELQRCQKCERFET